MVSEGGTKQDFRLDFATEAEAEQAAAEEGWRYVDENQFEWRLEVEEDLTAVKQAAKNRNNRGSGGREHFLCGLPVFRD